MTTQMTVFTKSIKLKCPECEREWYTFRVANDLCPNCEHELKDLTPHIIGRGTAEDVSKQKEPKWLRDMMR